MEYMRTYSKRDLLHEGLLSVAKKYAASRQFKEATSYVTQALDVR